MNELSVKNGEQALKPWIDKLLNISNQLPDYGVFTLFKIAAAYSIKEHSEEHIFPQDRNPVLELIKLLDNFHDMFRCLTPLSKAGVFKVSQKDTSKMKRGQIENITQKLFGDLWGGFSPDKFYDESLKSLTDRLKRNNVDIGWLHGKTCLDAGCGGGRYTIALSRLGVRKVIGADISDQGLKEAKKRANILGIKNVAFKKGNVLKLPFKAESFDFVLSNGVLHHTVNTEKGISEIARVLKKGGKMFLYLEGKGGLADQLASMIQEMLRNIPSDTCISTLKAIGLSGNRIFYFIDAIYVLLKNWSTPEETEHLLKKYGFGSIARLYRGTDYDDNEYLFNHRKRRRYAELIYGLGKLRYMAEKE